MEDNVEVSVQKSAKENSQKALGLAYYAELQSNASFCSEIRGKTTQRSVINLINLIKMALKDAGDAVLIVSVMLFSNILDK